MSELGHIIENVQAITNNLSQTQQSALAWNRQLAQNISYIIDQVGSTSQTDIKDCLVALRSAINFVSKMQEALGVSISVANLWIEKNSGAGATFPISNNVMTFVPEFENTSDGAAQPKLLTPDEVNERWKSVVSSTDQVLENYRDALKARGIQDNKLLKKFLQVQRAKMLKYEAAVLDEASGHGAVKDEDLYTYRIAGASGEYGFDSLANEYGAFCLEDTSKWIKDINPNFYDPFTLPSRNPYHVNCGSCAFAVDTRLSGGDDLVATQKNIGTDHAMEIATGKQCVYMPLESIEDYLRNQGAGSHLIVGINRGPAPNGCPQSGHWFNAFFDGVNFHTIDGQSAEILEWPYDYGDITEWCALI